MATVKGLLRGLRHIAHVFDQQKEPEMEIGLPTDVKHVAHIGWDGPSASDPSWMSGFEPVTELAVKPSSTDQKESEKPAKYLESVGSGTGERRTRRTSDKPKHKSRLKSCTNGEPVLDSPTKRRSDGTKQYGDSADDQSTCHDPACVPKSSRRKRTKVSEGSSRTLKSEGGNSVLGTLPEPCSKTDACQGLKNKDVKLSSAIEIN